MARVTDWLRHLLEADEVTLRRTIDPALPEPELRERLAFNRGHRSILDRHAGCGSGTGRCDDGGSGWDDGYEAGSPGCAEVQELADMYAHRPGHDPAWRF